MPFVTAYRGMACCRGTEPPFDAVDQPYRAPARFGGTNACLGIALRRLRCTTTVEQTAGARSCLHQIYQPLCALE